MLSTPASKAQLRADALALRMALADEQRSAAAERAVAALKPLLRRSETVSLYWPMRGEIDPRGLIADIHAIDGQVAMPVVADGEIIFRRFDGEDCLEAGVFGTRHPHAGMPRLDPHLIIAPLAAFDRRGGRIGYGAGHYDKAIAALMARGWSHRLAGIAFSCQEVEAVPVAPHDIILPVVATEHGLIAAEPAR